MPDISKIKLLSGNVYNIKDEEARRLIAQGISLVKVSNASDTPYGVTWDDDGTTITGTLVASADTKGKFYLVPAVTADNKDIFAEYVTVEGASSTYSWEKFGTTDIDLSSLGDLAYKDTASGNFTPQGSVSAPTVTVTPSSTTKYVASSADGGGSVSQGSPASCSMPVLSTTVENEVLEIGWTDGSFTPNTPTSVTLPTFASQDIVTGIQEASASAPTFTGTQSSVTVS